MALKDRRKELLDYIKKHEEFTRHNIQLFDIFKGNLLPHVIEVLRRSLTKEYFTQIEHRTIPINVLTRIIEKIAKVYATKPIRTANVSQEILEFYEEQFRMNKIMNTADEYATLFKGYALEPFIHKNQPRLRVLPFDRFLVKSDTFIDTTQMDVFIKFIGKRVVVSKKGKQEQREIFFTYTDEEFDAFDDEGDDFAQGLEDNDGVNPFEVIPKTYGNRSKDDIIPTIDTDMLQMTKVLPVVLTDTAGSIMFCCFPITWGIDILLENLTKSPNALWSLKSDPKSDKEPKLGQIKGEAQILDVLTFFQTAFALWLETKGVKVGSVGRPDAANFASGLSKIIDEMDTFEIRKVSIEAFIVEEKEFWKKMITIHNTWIDQGLLTGMARLPENWEVTTEFDEPKPFVDREKEVRTKAFEVEKRFKSHRKATKELNPNMSEKEINEMLKEIDTETNVIAEPNTDENNKE